MSVGRGAGGFQRRFLARVLPALAGANVAVSLAYGALVYQATRGQILDKQARLMPALAESLAEPLWGLRYEAVEKLLGGVIADADAVSAAVQDDRGHVVAAAGEAGDAPGAMALRHAIVHRQERFSEVAGTVILRVSLRRAWDDAANGLLAGLAAALASSLAVLAGVFSANRALIVRPLSALLAGIQRTRRDGARHRIALAGAGEEFDRVISTFNAMQDKCETDERERARLAARLDVALANMAQGIALYAAGGELLLANGRLLDLLGLPPGAVAPGMSFREVLAAGVEHGVHPGRDADRLFRERMGVVSRGEPARYTLELASGRVLGVSHEPLPDGGWVMTYEDVTDRRRSDERIVYLARHDALTGLPNRATFGERLEIALGQLGRGTHFAVLCLDLDRFKEVNDTLGHAVGDALLKAVAGRLGACVRETDTVARLGGDEFAVLQGGPGQPEQTTALARRLVEAVGAPYELDGHHVEIGVSVGIALAPGDGASAGALLRHSDMALYRAKAAGRGTWCYFEPGMDAEVQRRRALEADLKRALAEGQFEVHYQPLVEADTGASTGFEALLRWRHPERGMVGPGEFIPLAEEIGLIRPMGAWVLDRACADAASWSGHVKVAVNLSPVQFVKGDLVGEVERALAASGLAASRLELEITESVLLQDNEATLGLLHRLRALGVRICMDDFGTGYSSLSYLRRFPFDKIKVDQSFVRNLEREQGSIEIVRAVVGLGKALGMSVLAEGVETAEQLGILRGEGCDELQGYLFSKPRPVQDVPAIIAGHPVPKDGAARGPALVIDNAARGQAAA